MNLNDFQKQCSTTAIYGDVIDNIPPEELNDLLRMSYRALGLAGEAGEVADEIKKVIRNDRGLLSVIRKDKLKLELGDCLWYISAIAAGLGFTLEEIAEANIDKLQKRKERGFGN